MLGIMFCNPEEEVIKINDEPSAIYFIQQGDCVVNITDHNKKELIAWKLLVQGDHFGEISIIYHCKTTCQVLSRNYNTLARLGI